MFLCVYLNTTINCVCIFTKLTKLLPALCSCSVVRQHYSTQSCTEQDRILLFSSRCSIPVVVQIFTLLLLWCDPKWWLQLGWLELGLVQSFNCGVLFGTALVGLFRQVWLIIFTQPFLICLQAYLIDFCLPIQHTDPRCLLICYFLRAPVNSSGKDDT